jgi:hypothetical protein
MKHRTYFIALSFMAVCLLARSTDAGQLTLPLGTSVVANGNLTPVSELRPGDIVDTVDGRKLRIMSVQEIEETIPVHCIGSQSQAEQVAYITGSGVAVSHAFSAGPIEADDPGPSNTRTDFADLATLLQSALSATFRQAGIPIPFPALTTQWTNTLRNR